MRIAYMWTMNEIENLWLRTMFMLCAIGFSWSTTENLIIFCCCCGEITSTIRLRRNQFINSFCMILLASYRYRWLNSNRLQYPTLKKKQDYKKGWTIAFYARRSHSFTKSFCNGSQPGEWHRKKMVSKIDRNCWWSTIAENSNEMQLYTFFVSLIWSHELNGWPKFNISLRRKLKC